jgi:hypothetical protein
VRENVEPAELDDFRIVPPQPLDQTLNCSVEVEDHAAGMGVADHALRSKERRHARAARDRRDSMQAGRGIKDKLPGRQLDFMRAVIVFNDQFSASRLAIPTAPAKMIAGWRPLVTADEADDSYWTLGVGRSPFCVQARAATVSKSIFLESLAASKRETGQL